MNTGYCHVESGSWVIFFLRGQSAKFNSRQIFRLYGMSIQSLVGEAKGISASAISQIIRIIRHAFLISYH